MIMDMVFGVNKHVLMIFAGFVREIIWILFWQSNIYELKRLSKHDFIKCIGKSTSAIIQGKLHKLKILHSKFSRPQATQSLIHLKKIYSIVFCYLFMSL